MHKIQQIQQKYNHEGDGIHHLTDKSSNRDGVGDTPGDAGDGQVPEFGGGKSGKPELALCGEGGEAGTQFN